jgi:hypothetical protein
MTDLAIWIGRRDELQEKLAQSGHSVR